MNSRGIQGSRPSLLSWVLSRSKGWGQEEGAAGIPGEVTLFPYICVQRPSQSHTHANTHKCTSAHICIHSHMCNALVCRHTFTGTQTGTCPALQAMCDIPLPQEGMTPTKIVVNSAGRSASA